MLFNSLINTKNMKNSFSFLPLFFELVTSPPLDAQTTTNDNRPFIRNLPRFVKRIQYLLVLSCLFLCLSNLSGQNLLTNSSFETGTLGPNTAPMYWASTRVDYNDPSASSNMPRIGSTHEWIEFDGMANNNDSQEGGRAIRGENAVFSLMI